jgi:hypothetical protein
MTPVSAKSATAFNAVTALQYSGHFFKHVNYSRQKQMYIE